MERLSSTSSREEVKEQEDELKEDGGKGEWEEFGGKMEKEVEEGEGELRKR